MTSMVVDDNTKRIEYTMKRETWSIRMISLNGVKTEIYNPTTNQLFKDTKPGASIPSEAMMHFPPVSVSPIFDKFSDSVENFLNFTFSQKKFRFSSAKISDDLFFSHRPQISNFSLFSLLFQYISPL